MCEDRGSVREKGARRATGTDGEREGCDLRVPGEQLRLRGQRNYDRYMLFTKRFVERDGPERAQWQRESAEDTMRDAEWNQRHGPLPGGARILHWNTNVLATCT